MKKITQNFFFAPVLIAVIVFGFVGYFGGLVVHVPEVIIGLIGLCFVVLAYRSSIKAMHHK